MSRLAVFISLLHLPFYIYAADTGDGPNPSSSLSSTLNESTGLKDPSGLDDAAKNPSTGSSGTSESTSTSSSDGNLDDILSMDGALHPDMNHVDISGMEGLAGLLGISAATNERSYTASFLRWGAKQTGALQPDIAGVGSLNERRRSERILVKFANMAAPEGEFDADVLKQTLERQAATIAIAISLLKTLHDLNGGKNVSDIVIKIQAAQQILNMHEEKTLPPILTTALKTALAIARDSTAAQIQPRELDE